MIWMLSFFLFVSVICNLFLVYYLYKFTKIIFVFEDDISDTIQALDDAAISLENVNSLKMFFDDIQIRTIVAEVMDSIKMARFQINKMSKKFTERSKQKYILVEEIDEVSNEDRDSTEYLGNNKTRTVFHVGKNV